MWTRCFLLFGLDWIGLVLSTLWRGLARTRTRTEVGAAAGVKVRVRVGGRS